MTDREAWMKVREAAHWLSEGRAIQFWSDEIGQWMTPGPGYLRDGLRPDHKYRLAPEPPKPREWTLIPHPNGHLVAIPGAPILNGVHVREVLE